MPPFLAELLARQRFVITTHLRGDGDAVGSLLALRLFLKRVGKSVTCICPDAPSTNLEWLPGMDDLLVYDGSLEQSRALADADALVVVDTNAASRIGRLADSFRHRAGARFLIDHHPGPEKWFDYTYVRDDASSTGELIYELIELAEGVSTAEVIDADIATLLYTAIMTDTGSFRFNSVTPRVHRIVADLIELGGIVPDDIHTQLYDTRPLTSLRVLGRALERIDVRYDGTLGYLALSRQFMSDTGAERGDTEGLVNHVLSVDGVRVALFFLETDAGTKVSFRSHGDVAVNKWAASFGGGGHRNAAGAFIKGYLDEVVERVLESAPDYIDITDPATDRGDNLSDDDENYLELLNQGRPDR
jgi:phosphoesterase RecJ-like protein